MKTNSTPIATNNTPLFAFMPEMVLEHLRHAKPRVYAVEPAKAEAPINKITITADPEIPELDSYFEAYPLLSKNKVY